MMNQTTGPWCPAKATICIHNNADFLVNQHFCTCKLFESKHCKDYFIEQAYHKIDMASCVESDWVCVCVCDVKVTMDLYIPNEGSGL